MKPSMIDRIGKAVACELDKLPTSEDYLPMPQFHSKKISCYEWQHWIQRLERQRHKDPNYENGLDRIAKVTVQTGWSLLGAPEVLEPKSRPPTYKFMDETAVAERIANARTGLFMGIALFVCFGLKNKRVTFTDLVDVLAGAFSPCYLSRPSIVSSIRELSLESVRNCRRDLHLRGVLADRIWDAISTWEKNPLFRLEKDELGHDTVITPRLLQKSSCLGDFQTLIASDLMFERWPGQGLRLKITNRSGKPTAAGEHKPFARPQRQKICAERPYNVVVVDEAATALLRIQEGVTLYFDVDEFEKDYIAAEQTAKRVKRELIKNYGVRAYLSIRPRKFSKEGKKLTSIPRVSEVLYRSYAVALLMSEHDTGMSTGRLSDDYIRETYANIHDPYRVENDKERKWYLGRQYRLKVVRSETEQVKLRDGFIEVHSRNPNKPESTLNLVETWFKERAHKKFGERLEICLNRFPEPEVFKPAGMIIRRMEKRWGSLTPAQRLVLNLRLIYAPVDAIDYVITHELCHMAHNHHGSAFLRFLQQVMPDWQKRKIRLETFSS
jgi:predicted metal-dependent hydrolase